MGFEIRLHFARGHAYLAPDLVPHHLLGNDAVADVGLEVLVGDTLLRGGLFQVIHRLEMILLSDLIQPLDQLGFASDAQFLTFGKQKLLVNQVAK